MTNQHGLLISIVSGKGGVGKTMLAVAIARELSANVRTLLLDLDFFNRGLTGLMRHGRVLQQITPPEFLANRSSPLQSGSWELVEVAPNLVHIRYPDFTPEQIQQLENSDTVQLASALKGFLSEINAIACCEAMVIDCHGGPDQLSFAACLASDYSLLISEPDKITFYGTLHFLRQLARVVPKDSAFPRPDVRLVFNKVVPAFSGVYLRRFYDTEVRKLFDGRPLLAVFPMEIYLTKEFERTPILTDVYPSSLLAKKTQVLLHDLLQTSHPELVPKSLQRAFKVRLFAIRNSVGRTPWFADLNSVMAIIAIGGVLVFAVELYGRHANSDVGGSVGTLEVIQYARNHPQAVPADCATKAMWEDRLTCWRTQRHEHQGGITISDYYGNPELQRIMTTAYRNPENERIRLLQDRELRSDPDQTIRNLYEKIDIPWYASRGLQVFQLFERVDDSLAMVAIAWFVIVLIMLWSAGIDRFFTYHARRQHRAYALLILVFAMALWFVPLLAVTALFGEAHRFVAQHRRAEAITVRRPSNPVQPRVDYSQPREYSYPQKTTFVLVAICVVVVAGAVSAQWFKANQNLRYEKQLLEGIERLVFGFYIVSAPFLL